MENVAERQSHFGIRKLIIGAASVLLGTTLWMSNGNVVQASDNGNDGNNGDHAADDSKTETPKITDDTKVVIEKSDDAAQAAQSQNQTNDNAQSQEAQADQNKVESSAVEKAQTESAQADTSVQQTQQNTEKSAKSDKDQTTKDQVAENAKEALEVQKQKAETVTNSNSKTSTETINKEASAESAKQSSAQEATKAAENAESNVTKAIDNSNATLATTNEVAVAGQTLKTAGIQGNTNQKDAKSNDNTVNVDLSKLGVTGTTDKGIQKTSFAVKRLLSANTQNLESNEVNVQQFSPQALASLFTTSLVQTSGSGSNDATDIDTYTPNFNITENPEYQQYFAAIPADQYAFQSYEVVSTGQKIVVTTDKNDIGNNIRFYNVRNGSAQLVYQMTRDTQTNANGTVVREEASQQGTFTTAGVASNSTYKGGTYNWSLNQTNSVNFAGIGNLKIGRIDITAGNSNSPVDNGTGAFVTDDAHRITITWDQGRPISDSIIPGKTWNSAGSNIPDKVTQKIWYVDAETGKVLSYKTSAKAFNGSSYDSTSNELKTITKDGKTYQLVARGSDGLYSSSDFSDILNKQLTTNNGVPITVGDLLSTPLKGILGDGRIGNIRASITNYQGTRSYTRLQTKTDGTIDLNTYLFDAGSTKGTLIPGLSQANVAPGQTVMGAHLADTGSGAFYNGTKPGNRDIIILYKAATPVANKQNANITFINDDTSASLSPQQNASGDAGSQISFDNAASTVADLINKGYIYNGTTGTGVTNGSPSGSFTSVGFPVYDNDDNTTQEFIVHFKSPVQTTTYHQGVEESKTIKRTINYYDKVTGAKIPQDLIATNPYSDSVTFTRTQVLDQDGKVVGYGTITTDGKSFSTQDWHTAEGLTTDEFAPKKSADLSAFNYTAPEFQDGKSASSVAAHKVTPTTQDLVYNVYYGHQTQQVTTNQDVTRRFHYIFTDGTTPESHLTPQGDQKVSFTGTATKDLVTGKTGDTVWSPSTGTLAQVAGQTVAGYHITGNVNANADGSANAVTVNPDSGDIDVTIVYTPDAKTPDTPQKAKVTIYDKTENNTQLAAFENNKGTKGSAISFDGEPQTLQAYLNSGYVFDSAIDANGNSIGTASNINFGNFDSIDGNLQSFNIYLVHGTDTKTETAATNAHVNYVVAGNEANKPAAPADSPTQTINWTRTNTTDKVTGATTEGTWTPDKNSFTSVTSPTLTGYTPDQAVANFTTPQPNRDQVVTVVYNPNPQEDQKADLVIYDKTDNNKELNNFNNSGKTGTPISFSGSANYVADLIAKGYKIDSFVNDQNQTSNPTSYDQINFSNFDNNSSSDQHFKLYLVHDTENVTDKKTTTSTVHYVVSDGKTNPPADNTQTITWTRPGTKDKVTGVTTPTGNWTTPDHYNDVPTPNLDGYTPDKTNVPVPTPDPNQNPTTVVTYNPKTPEAPTYTGTTETKTITRTINYYDKVTGEKIPSELIKENPTTQNVTLSRMHVVSSTGQDMGYGSVSADGKTFTKATTADGWNTGDWAQVTSPDLSNAGYTAPDLAQADHVTVDANTKDAVVNVYYGHQTEVITPKTPHNPGGNINPNDPRNKPSVYPDGLTKGALTTEVTRKINYVGVNEDGTTTPVNGSPDGKSTYTQTVSFERNAVIDKVTGQILGYSTDGTTNVTTTDKDRAWTPTTQNMDSVASKTPSEVGYDKVDISTVGGVTVYPGQKVNDVTVTYTKNKSPEVTQKAILEIIDNNDANAPKQLASFSNEGKSEDQITFANSNEILQSYLSQGYKVQKTAGNLSGDAQSGYTYPTYGNTAQDFKIYLIHDTEDKTETAQATAQVHYVVADNGVPAPADSDLQTITYTRTNKVDKVNGTVVTEGTWQADKNAFTDVDSPDLSKDGYTPSLATVQFNAPERNVNQRVTVVYNRSAQAADLQIIDDNDPQNQRVLATYSAGGESGKQISFDGSNTQLQNYLKNGYTFEKSEGQGMSGDATNGFTYPSFDNDSNTNQSFKIYLKHATGEKKETATTTAHVHYIMADGTKAPDDSPTQTINWTRTNTVDQVTGAIVNEGTWSSDKNAFADVDSPAVTGYTPGTKTVKFATPERDVNQVVNVVYTKDAPTPDKQNALVVYQDVNDPAHPVDLGQSDQLTGQAGDSINYSTADKIAEYEKQGYVLVSNGFDANGTKPSFDNINGNTQTFYVTFKHGIQPVTPTTPGTPDQPINPDNPDGPKYPNGTDKTSLTKDVTRTVTYEGAGDKTPSPVTDTLHFQGTGYLDKVNGKWTDANGKELSDQTKGITWTITDGTKDEGSFNLVPTKHIDGYTSKVVTDGADDGNGNVKSYTGITHASDNINVVVQYNPIVAEQGNLIVKFHDDTDNKDLTGVGTDTGTQDVGTQVTYNPSTDLTNLENKGYVYVSTDGNIPPSIVKGTTTVTIHVKHGTVPVTPDNPGTPDKPINPNDPDGPKYPSGTDKASIDKTITRTVHYEGADQYTPNDVQQPVHFTAKGELDKVTGEWTTPLTWSEDQTFSGVTTPKIPGYHVVSVDKDTTDNQNVDSAKISHTGSDYTVTVKYAKDAAPTPDTTTGKVTYIDDTAKTTLKTDSLSGNVGANIDYTTQGKINNYINMGYKLVSNNFIDGKEVFNKDAAKNNFEVHLVHDTVPVTPDNPGTPDKPINPKDPRPKDEQPKYPTGTGETDLTKDITRTVHYEGADQYTPNDVQQPVHFTAKGVLDKVTGEWTTPLTWSADQTFKGVTTPKIPGYHVVSVDKDTTDNQNVDSAKISHTGSDYTVTVKYAKDAAPTPKTQQNAQLTIRDVTLGQERDLGSYTQPGLEGDAISFGSAQEFVQNLLNKGYVWDGASYNGTNLDATNYAGIKFGNYDNTDDKNDISQKWVINLVHGVTPVNPDHPDDKDGYTKKYLDRTITRDVTYVDEKGNEMPELTPEHQEAKFQGSGYLDNVTGKWVTVENGKITGLAQGLTWTPDKDANFDAIAAKTAEGYHVVSVSGNGISGFTVSQDGAVTAQTVSKDTPSSTIKVVYAKTPVTPTPANGSIVYIDDTTGNTLENANFGGNVGDKINYTTANRIANYEKKGYNVVSNNFHDGQETFTNGENKFEVHLVHATTPITPENPGKPGQEVPNPNDPNNPHTIPDNFVPQTLTKTVTRDVTYVYEDGNQAETPVHQTFTFNGNGTVDLVTGQLVTVENGKITGAGKITWNADNHDFDATKAIDTTQYNIVKVSENNTSANVDMNNGVVASETITPNSQNSKVVITLAKKEAPTPADQTVVGKQVVHYVDEQGNKLRDDNTNDTFVFTKPGKTGQWNETSHKYTDANAVVIDGYVSDQKTYTGQTATPEDANKEITIVYHKIGKIIPVDPSGNPIPDPPTPGYHNDPNDPSKVTPNEPTPNIPGWTTDVPNVTPEVPTKDTPVPYTKNPDTPVPANGSIVYIDDTTGNTLENATFSGNVGDKINYTTADRITNYTNKGYKLVSNNFKDGNETFAKDGNKFEVHFVHDTVPVTPTDPGKPGQPINPNDPNGPKYPDSTSQTDLTKTVTRTINYVGDGLNIPASHTEIEFTGSGVLDKVTGQWTTPLTWTVKGGNSDSGNFEQVDGPKADGYYITNISSSNEDLGDIDSTTGTVASKTINHANGNIVITINYAKKPVTPTPVEKGTVIVNYVDKTTGNTLETTTSTGNEGSNVNYSTKDTITKYTNRGYKLSHDGYPTGNVTYTNGAQTYTVEFVHDTVPVTPTDPGKPGQPINPNDPNGPKYPDGTGQTDLTKTVTRTINYVGDGLNIPASHTEIEFTGNGVLDKVTGQWTTPLTWTVKGGDSDSGNFEQVDGPKADGYYITNISSSNEDLGDIDSTTGTVASKTINHANGNIVITINYAKKTTPTPADQTVVGKQVVHYVDEQGNKLRDDNTNETFVFTKPGKTGQWNETSHKYADANAVVIDGYVSDQKTYEGQTATPEDANKEVTIVYHKIGKIIPVDPSGNPIPDAPTPGYHNDPTDPSKVTPNEPTPNVPGWTTDVPNVTPEVPTKDTNVPYTKNTPTPAQGSVTIVVHDKTTNTDLTDYGYTTSTVDEGSKVVYDHDKTVTDLTNKGYKLVQDIAVPSTVDGSDKTLTMIVEHDTVTITPDKPGTPGQPINPNDPNGPKWDNGTDAKSLTKTGTQTVHYQGAGNQTPQDNVSTVKFEHSITYDRVTGKVVKDNGWTSSQTYETVATPTVDGYTPDKTNVGGETVSVDQNGNGDIDKSYVVTYTKNQVPTPTPTPTPEPQPTPQTVNGKQTITFVDGDNGNTPLRDPDVQTHKFTNGESSYTFGTINVPVIDGYVAEVKTAGGKTVTPANPDVNVTVVYHKIGKIVPVDPDHNPIPGADQPSYHNDPTDPTKVVPDEPVPTIDGYTPDQNSVTPVDPTKDTEVVYRKKETPKKPETPKTPEEPTTPEEPKKENNKPKPTTPKPTPNYNNNIAPHSQSGYWNNNIAPHATSVNGWTNNIGPHGETVDANGNIVAPNGEIIGYVDANGNPHYTKSGEKSKTLPQTGEKTNDAAAALGGLSAGLGLIGLAGVKKRRRKED